MTASLVLLTWLAFFAKMLWSRSPHLSFQGLWFVWQGMLDTLRSSWEFLLEPLVSKNKRWVEIIRNGWNQKATSPYAIGPWTYVTIECQVHEGVPGSLPKFFHFSTWLFGCPLWTSEIKDVGLRHDLGFVSPSKGEKSDAAIFLSSLHVSSQLRK